MQRPDKVVKKKWKVYTFKVAAMYFLYFKTEEVISISLIWLFEWTPSNPTTLEASIQGLIHVHCIWGLFIVAYTFQGPVYIACL